MTAAELERKWGWRVEEEATKFKTSKYTEKDKGTNKSYKSP